MFIILNAQGYVTSEGVSMYKILSSCTIFVA